MTVVTSNDDCQLTVGCRVECEGYHATVHFIGEVPPTKGVWLGVEWDDPSRGKHDGSKDGHRFFSTQHPTSGSFLRPKKVNGGQSFMGELRDRYGVTDDGTAGIVEEDMFVVGHGGKHTTVQVVGAQKVNIKQSKFTYLKEVSLRGTKVSSAGCSGDIATNLPSLEELDISLNLISSWGEVARITSQLQNLTQLNVSDNMLHVPQVPTEYQDAFSKCQTVVLNRMKYSWDQVLQCCMMFPSLKKLHSCFNSISKIDVPYNSLQNVRLLNLESNAITDWKNILNLGGLKHLETLILNDCNIEEIVFPDVSFNSNTSFFPKLQSLSMSQNKISQWTSIDELNKLATLREFTFRNNPLLNPDKSLTDRYLIIAKLDKLNLFNRTQVLADERKGAEGDYLKMFGLLWRSSGGHQDPAKNQPTSQFCQQHPRFQIFIDKYGPPEDSELKPHSSALKNSLITILIDSPMIPDKPPIKKKLPDSMTIQKLKAILQRLYKIDPINMGLTYTSHKMSQQEIELESDGHELSYYSVEDGDVIHVKW